MEYPRLVYKAANVHQVVKNASEYAEALKLGYYGSVPEAIAKAHSKTPDLSVTVYKGREKHKAATQAEADALIVGDGWFLTEDDAKRAAWPTTPEAIEAVLADLNAGTVDRIRAAGVEYGVTFEKNAKPGEMLKAISARLATGFDGK